MKHIFVGFLLILFGCSDYDITRIKDDVLPGGDTGQFTNIIDTGFLEDTASEIDEPEPDPSRPIAICDVFPEEVSPPFESTTWFGIDSYDVDSGNIVEYNWSLVDIPAGSASSMPVGGANRGPFVPDVAGEYTGKLIVVNNIGVESEPCEVTVTARPSENLWVELFWSVPNDDLDLHLLNDSGNTESGDDCYYSNCTPLTQIFFPVDWGIPGNTDDNPMLDLDDIPGVGPENININSPASNGFYTVIVHDYTGSTPDFRGANEATINIYINGTLAWSGTKSISGEGSYTHFADINWNTGMITAY
jgi:hypothetical protein